MNATLTPPITQRTTLYYREGSSDKVYQAAIGPQDDGFLVTFAFGRRGSTLTTGTKTPEPVDIDTATKIYEKLVREKKSKGYTEGPDGTPYQRSDKQDRIAAAIGLEGGEIVQWELLDRSELHLVRPHTPSPTTKRRVAKT